MRRIRELKKMYDETPIPEELASVVAKAIAEASGEMASEKGKIIEMNNTKSGGNEMEKRDEMSTRGEKMKESKDINGSSNSKNKHNRKLFRVIVSSAAALAVLVGSFGVAVNKSPSFAASMSDVPILGSLVNVFTGEQLATEDKVCKIDIKLPAVEGINDKAFEKSLNNEIKEKMNAVAKESQKRAAENKKAWLETGGKESEYTPVEININYEVKSISDTTLSFIVFKMETGASAYYENYYYNIDLTTNKEIKLTDVLKTQLGENYNVIASKQIKEEMAKRSKETDAVYWDGTDGIDGFTNLTGKEKFYINDNGNVVIEFNKYEIAPGYVGIQDFEITR